jgi:hypothetical protein
MLKHYATKMYERHKDSSMHSWPQNLTGVVSLTLYPKRRPMVLIRQKTCWAPEMCQRDHFCHSQEYGHPYCNQPLYWSITTCIKANQSTKKAFSTTTKIFPGKLTLWIMCISHDHCQKYGEIYASHTHPPGTPFTVPMICRTKFHITNSVCNSNI